MSNVCEVYFSRVCSSQSFSSSFSHPFFLLLSLTTQWPSLYHHNQLIGQRLCLSPFILLDLYLYIGLCAWSFQSERICFFLPQTTFFFFKELRGSVFDHSQEDTSSIMHTVFQTTRNNNIISKSDFLKVTSKPE